MSIIKHNGQIFDSIWLGQTECVVETGEQINKLAHSFADEEAYIKLLNPSEIRYDTEKKVTYILALSFPNNQHL